MPYSRITILNISLIFIEDSFYTSLTAAKIKKKMSGEIHRQTDYLVSIQVLKLRFLNIYLFISSLFNDAVNI
jgi:hypothetical protein